MGILSAVRGPFIYLDTNIFIYALEAYTEYISELIALFDAVDRGLLHAVTSELTLAEALVKPLMDADAGRQRVYEAALQSSAFLRVVPVSRAVLTDAAQVRATSSLRLPDAIHAATCLRGSCETFLTNDAGFRAVSGLPVVILSEVV